jgi:hypothetical protein
VQIEQEIMMHISQWERQTGRQFLIDGLHFDEFVRKQHCEYSAEKENEKMIRVMTLVYVPKCSGICASG